jgi:hypothetical protein
VRFSAHDERGGTCAGTVVVCVRHDRRPGGTCGDQGPLFDSTAGAPACSDGTCEPEDCSPSPDDVAPASCRNDRVPPSVEVRVGRARDLLERVARANGTDSVPGLSQMAARQLRRAAKSARRAFKREGLSEGCADALQETLENAGDCAACTAD